MIVVNKYPTGLFTGFGVLGLSINIHDLLILEAIQMEEKEFTKFWYPDESETAWGEEYAPYDISVLLSTVEFLKSDGEYSIDSDMDLRDGCQVVLRNGGYSTLTSYSFRVNPSGKFRLWRTNPVKTRPMTPEEREENRLMLNK